jgi:hypothetical protein
LGVQRDHAGQPKLSVLGVVDAGRESVAAKFGALPMTFGRGRAYAVEMG